MHCFYILCLTLLPGLKTKEIAALLLSIHAEFLHMLFLHMLGLVLSHSTTENPGKKRWT